MFFCVWGGFAWHLAPRASQISPCCFSCHVGQFGKTQMPSSTELIWNTGMASQTLVLKKNRCTWHKHDLEMQCRACDLAQKENTHSHAISARLRSKKRSCSLSMVCCEILRHLPLSLSFFFNSCVPMSLWLNSVSLSSLGRVSSHCDRVRGTLRNHGVVSQRLDTTWNVQLTRPHVAGLGAEQSTRTDWNRWTDVTKACRDADHPDCMTRQRTDLKGAFRNWIWKTRSHFLISEKVT